MNPKSNPKYVVDIEYEGKSVKADVYSVLRAFKVTDPAIAHAIKKLLACGSRGHKNARTDLQEAIESIEDAMFNTLSVTPGESSYFTVPDYRNNKPNRPPHPTEHPNYKDERK